MGGSSGQVTGYKYLANFLLFIGNPIEKLLNINFDKRGWIANERISYGSNGEMIYIEKPNLYGENEGGVAGTMRVKHGTNNQTVSTQYKKYMSSLGLPASAYPYQSYIMFGGGGFPQGSWDLSEEELETIGDELEENDQYYNSGAFYVGNSGYMKEMLLWPKRIHVRNDGRAQWYDAKAEIFGYVAPDEDGERIDSFNVSVGISCEGALAGDTTTITDWSQDRAGKELALQLNLNEGGGWYGEGGWDEPGLGSTLALISFEFDVLALHTVRFSFVTDDYEGRTTYIPTVQTNGGKVKSHQSNSSGGGNNLHSHVIRFVGTRLDVSITVDTHDSFKTSENPPRTAYSNNIGLLSAEALYPTLYTELPVADGTDINPIHKIREILTDDTAMNKPESSVNNENFIKAADRIYDEGLGISWSITEKACIDAINELCYHIEAGIRVNRQTGLYEMVLFRDDWFEEDEIHSIPENKIKKGSMQYEITNADEVINQVNVNFYDRANIKNSSFSISESGLIQTLGRVNAETVDFPYFMNMRNAEIVANWKLKILSTGVLKGSFTTGWREARKWNRYDLIRLPWSRRWAEPILGRIMNIKLGGPTSNEVSIEWVEVVPSTGMINTTIVADDPVDTQPAAPKPCNAKVFELPYFEAVQAIGEREVGIELADNPEVGYLCAIAEKPQNNSLNAALYADSGSGFERVATVNYCETAYLDQAIDRLSNTFVVKNVGNIASVRVGSQIFINDETMVYQSYDAETKVLTVKRGAFGVPQIHTANSILYFADDFIAVDQTLYVDGEIVEAKVLTTTPSGVLALVDAATHVVEMSARAIRPYPPANVKINGEYWPETLLVTNDIVLTWAHRSRIQQTGGEIIGWYDGDVTVESGVTYAYELISENVVLDSQSGISANTATIIASVLKPNKAHTLKIWSVRDGYESYQKFEHSFFAEAVSLILTATATKNQLLGNTVPTADISVNVDETLRANLKYNSSSISGKAQPGSSITIEVNE